jgi:1-deoxy-D-xylulose-5-phosphate synthase
MKVLNKINDPGDLKDLSIEELETLADEIRQVIIETVSKTGGHIAPSLGVVELTLAVHRVFDSPRDRIVWDVGHQSYAHKLITGRKDKFHTLRQYGGISGFPKRSESVHDTFDVGHSSNSISAGLGMAEAIRKAKEKRKVVAIIGDGSMTAGIAFEGLNQAGTLDSDLIVILNDNEMSISPNVGALSAYLNRIMTGQWINRAREEIKAILSDIPGIGKSMYKFMRQAEESVKGLMVPGILFEELGLKYFGPIDGHRLEHLIKTLENVKKLNGPILVHVVTQKGKGYLPAENLPSKFHGIGKFDIETGETTPKTRPSYTEIFSKTLINFAEKDPNIIAITAAMPSGTGLDRFQKAFPDRFYDVGIAEQHAVTFAAGMALEGLKPVVAIYSTFLQRAFDQVISDACMQDIPLNFALDRGGIVGEDGETHQGVFDLGYLRMLPNMVLMVPKDGQELKDVIATALEIPHPTAYRYPRGSIPDEITNFEGRPLPFGKWEVLHQTGEECVILAVGATVYPALDAALEAENRHGISTTVVNARFIKPMDTELLKSLVPKAGFLMTVEENVVMGGFGSAVLEQLSALEILPKKAYLHGLPDAFIPHGATATLREIHKLDEKGILETLVDRMGLKRKRTPHLRSAPKTIPADMQKTATKRRKVT